MNSQLYENTEDIAAALHAGGKFAITARTAFSSATRRSILSRG